MSNQAMRITLTVWRQPSPDVDGKFETYDVPGVSPDMSFLEMLDVVNERLMHDGKEPIAKLVPFRPPAPKRRFGALRGIISIGPEFFDPLPAQELEAWEQ